MRPMAIRKCVTRNDNHFSFLQVTCTWSLGQSFMKHLRISRQTTTPQRFHPSFGFFQGENVESPLAHHRRGHGRGRSGRLGVQHSQRSLQPKADHGREPSEVKGPTATSDQDFVPLCFWVNTWNWDKCRKAWYLYIYIYILLIHIEEDMMYIIWQVMIMIIIMIMTMTMMWDTHTIDIIYRLCILYNSFHFELDEILLCFMLVANVCFDSQAAWQRPPVATNFALSSPVFDKTYL